MHCCRRRTNALGKLLILFRPRPGHVPHRSPATLGLPRRILGFRLGSTGVAYYPPFLLTPTTNNMSKTSPEAASRSNYQSIFDGALESYQRKTGNDLTKDPLLRILETCNSPDEVLAILRRQLVVPGQSHSSSDEFTKWLIPTVKVIHAFTATVGGAVGLVSFSKVEVISPISPLIFINIHFGDIPTFWGDFYGYRSPSLSEDEH